MYSVEARRSSDGLLWAAPRSGLVRKRRLVSQHRSRHRAHFGETDARCGDSRTRDAYRVDHSVHHTFIINRPRVLPRGVEDIPTVDRSEVDSGSRKQAVTISLQWATVLCVELRHVVILHPASDIATERRSRALPVGLDFSSLPRVVASLQASETSQDRGLEHLPSRDRAYRQRLDLPYRNRRCHRFVESTAPDVSASC